MEWTLGVFEMVGSDLDYGELGLKVGLELHQQLSTRGKLFCRCPTELRKEDPDSRVVRFMRPTLSEMGEFDPTALMEFKKGKRIVYEIYDDSTCLYEIDEIPPFEVDEEAVNIAIEIALLFNVDVLDEWHISRKQYLDGSVPTGFQRTMIVGTGGFLSLKSGKKIRVSLLSLEEDACREIDENEEEIVWRTDRIGIPLVEIATYPDMSSPEEAEEAAHRISRLLRGTGHVRRGLGTVRQDINVSIEGGTRAEVKGVQKLEWVVPLVRNEVLRQLALLEIRDELERRGVKSGDLVADFKDVTNIFSETKAKFIKKAVSKGDIVLGVKLSGFGGLLGKEVQPGRRFGKEIADRARVIAGVGGIIHTDELPAYNISEEEKEALLSVFGAGADADCVVVVVSESERAMKALEECVIRAKETLDGVPPETRRALPEGNTEFERPLGGGARMYPDTDTPPISIPGELVEKIRTELPEYPWVREEKYVKELKLPETLAHDLAVHDYAVLFEIIVSELGIDPMLVATTVLQKMKALGRDGVPVDRITRDHLWQVFELLAENRVAKEVIDDLLTHLANNPGDTANMAVEKLELETVPVERLRVFIREVVEKNLNLVKERGEKSVGPLMGEVMKEFRGKIDGKTVSRILKEEIKTVLGKG